MSGEFPLVPNTNPIVLLTTDNEASHGDVAIAATRDRVLIQRWAQQHQAEPATGEYTASGAGTVHVNDGGAGIRFNFPASSRFRPISWEEWFDNFDRHNLVFVWDRRSQHPDSSYRYRLVTRDTLERTPVVEDGRAPR